MLNIENLWLRPAGSGRKSSMKLMNMKQIVSGLCTVNFQEFPHQILFESKGVSGTLNFLKFQ